MLKDYYYEALRKVFRTAAWVRYNLKNAAPVFPDEIIEVDPQNIENKTLIKPNISRLINAAVEDGEWDTVVEKVKDDIVYQSFVGHFIDGSDWKDTPYVYYLKGDVTEHGSKSDAEIISRCQKLDDLYTFIRDNGYKTQRILEAESDILIESWKHKFIPPEFREVSVNVARDGKLLWLGGFHRLCIAMILKLERIPVRIAVRHLQWQRIRNEIANKSRDPAAYQAHADIQNILARNNSRKVHSEND